MLNLNVILIVFYLSDEVHRTGQTLVPNDDFCSSILVQIIRQFFASKISDRTKLYHFSGLQGKLCKKPIQKVQTFLREFLMRLLLFLFLLSIAWISWDDWEWLRTQDRNMIESPDRIQSNQGKNIYLNWITLQTFFPINLM